MTASASDEEALESACWKRSCDAHVAADQG